MHRTNIEKCIDKIGYDAFMNAWTEELNKKYFYIIQLGGKYKIGISRRLESRLNVYKSYPFEYKEIFRIDCDNFMEIEKSIAIVFKEYRIKGEWYNFSDVSMVINYVKANAKKI